MRTPHVIATPAANSATGTAKAGRPNTCSRAHPRFAPASPVQLWGTDGCGEWRNGTSEAWYDASETKTNRATSATSGPESLHARPGGASGGRLGSGRAPSGTPTGSAEATTSDGVSRSSNGDAREDLRGID